MIKNEMQYRTLIMLFLIKTITLREIYFYTNQTFDFDSWTQRMHKSCSDPCLGNVRKDFETKLKKLNEFILLNIFSTLINYTPQVYLVAWHKNQMLS